MGYLVAYYSRIICQMILILRPDAVFTKLFDELVPIIIRVGGPYRGGDWYNLGYNFGVIAPQS